MNGTPATAPQAQATDNGDLPVRGVFRFREHTLGPDRRPEAVPITYTMYCATCGAMGPTSETSEDSTEWAVGHLKDTSDHLDYRENITRPYRAVPGAWR